MKRCDEEYRYGSLRVLQVHENNLQKVVCQLVPIADGCNIVYQDVLSSFIFSHLSYNPHESILPRNC